LPALHRISDRVYWLPPGPPDRPSLCAVVGERRTVMLDAGASAAHARLFLDGLAAEGAATPSYVALTHSHWDHVFGAAEVNEDLSGDSLIKQFQQMQRQMKKLASMGGKGGQSIAAGVGQPTLLIDGLTVGGTAT